VRKADVAGVRDRHGPVGRVARDHVREVHERSGGALVVRHRERRRPELVARVRRRRREARTRLIRRDGETDQHERRERYAREERGGLAHLLFLSSPPRRSIPITGGCYERNYPSRALLGHQRPGGDSIPRWYEGSAGECGGATPCEG